MKVALKIATGLIVGMAVLIGIMSTGLSNTHGQTSMKITQGMCNEFVGEAKNV